MPTVWLRSCILFILGFGLSACASQQSYIYDDEPADPIPLVTKSVPKPVKTPAAPPPSSASSPSREKLAASYQEQGRYAEALLQWKILLTTHPGDTRYETRVRQTEEQIDKLATQHQRAGIAALDKSDFSTARHELLAALALDPKRTEVLDSLRRIEYDRVWRIQSAKLEKLKVTEDRKTAGVGEQERSYLELGAMMFREGDYNGAIREIQKYLNSYPGDPQAKKLISEVYAKLAAQQRQQGQLQNALSNVEQAKRFNSESAPANRKAEQEMRTALAGEYYEKGLRALRSDLKLAIESFEKALEYNPQHSKAREKLADAQRMQKKLEEISK